METTVVTQPAKTGAIANDATSGAVIGKNGSVSIGVAVLTAAVTDAAIAVWCSEDGVTWNRLQVASTAYTLTLSTNECESIPSDYTRPWKFVQFRSATTLNLLMTVSA